MVTLFDSARRVKSACHNFALGLVKPACHERREPYSAADLEWAAVELNKEATDYDVEPDYDALAGEAEAQARLDMGWCL
jgi:hypothetical protein